MGKFYVYILESDTGSHYIGQTSDIENRLTEHNSGITKSTKNRGRWKVIYAYELDTRTEAMKLEAKLKRMKNWRKAKEYLENLK